MGQMAAQLPLVRITVIHKWQKENIFGFFYPLRLEKYPVLCSSVNQGAFLHFKLM